MSKNKFESLIVDIESEDVFRSLVASNSVTIIDVYKEWCGPCQMIKPTLNSLYLDIDDCEERVNFARMNIDKLGSLLDGVEVSETCRPIFLLYKEGSLLKQINGLDSPTIQSTVLSNLPPPPQHTDEEAAAN